MDRPVGLLLDEDPAMRTPVAVMLRQRGVQVVEAGSLEEAYGLALFGKLHCVIARLRMADALTLRERLRNTPVTVTLPVVLIESGAARHVEAPADDLTIVLAEPVSGADLAAAVEQAIASARPAGAAPPL